MNMNLDLTNHPDRHRGRQAAQAALIAQRNGQTDEANAILSEVLTETLTRGEGGLIAAYASHTTVLLSAILRVIENEYGTDVEGLLQRVFLEMEAD